MGREIRHTIGKKIKEYRRKKTITQAELSEASQVKYKYIQQIEGKNPPNIRVDTLARIAKGLGVSPWSLLKSQE